jgi:putative Holliday junction resolvase
LKRVLGLDVGERRIGVALSDPSGLLASPLMTIRRGGGQSDVDEVVHLVAQHDVDEIIVGLPLSLSGQIGAQAKRTAEFARALTEAAPVPVNTVDERYSSVQAERILRESGVQPSRDKARVDAVAAAVILQSYLDYGQTSTL